MPGDGFVKKLAGGFVWCDLHMQNRPFLNCPKCRKFPCRNLGLKELQAITAHADLVPMVEKLSRERIGLMLFIRLKDQKIVAYKGSLDSLGKDKQGEDATEAFEVSHRYEQHLRWVPRAKSGGPDASENESAHLQECLVERKDGEITFETIDPKVPVENAVNIYPVKTVYVKQFVSIKKKLEEVDQKSKSSRKKKQAVASEAEK